MTDITNKQSTQKPWLSIIDSDPEIFKLIDREFERQNDGLEMIASENFADADLLAMMGNPLSNKYAEGRPGKRYYGGCEVVDEMENIAINRVCQLFGAKFANVQPHSGSQANAAVYRALINPGDKILGLDLSHGGHLTHGSAVNFSGTFYESHFYTVDANTHRIDYDQVTELARRIRPKIIIAGASAYARSIDFAKFRQIADEVSAYLFVDMSHIAGLVAAGLHSNPIPYAHVVSSTTHKTLRGPRGGVILWNDENLTLNLNKAVFPGIQGGPLEHIIAAKAVCFKKAMSPEFKTYQTQVLINSQSLAGALISKGFKLVSNGTDNHLILIDLTESMVTGKDLEEGLNKAAISVNKNTVPGEKRSPFVTSGVRIGTSAVTSRGMKTAEMEKIADWITRVYHNLDNEDQLAIIKREVLTITKSFPLYPNWL